MLNFNLKNIKIWRIIVPEDGVTHTTLVWYYSRKLKILHLNHFGVELEISALGEVTEAAVGCLVLWITTATTKSQIET